MGGMVGALAIFTIGAAIVIAAFLFLQHNRDPKNLAATKNVAEGGKAASTRVAEDAPEGSYHDRTLKERLDDSGLSRHPLDPDPAKQGISS